MSKTKSGLELGEVDTGLFELGDVVIHCPVCDALIDTAVVFPE